VDEALKQKIVGALVVTAALIVFVPTIFDEPILEESLIKVDVSSEPGDLNVADFDVLERRQHLENALQRIEAVRSNEQEAAGSASNPSTEGRKKDVTDKEVSPLREAVTNLVENIKDAAGERGKPEELAAIQVWTVQLASFIKKENALKLRHVLRQQGEKAYIKEKKSTGGLVFRVYVGPMLKAEDASAALKRLNKAHDLQGMVIRYVPE
jgi:DedD protein